MSTEQRVGGYRLGFLAAWTFLVVMVAFGFFVQAQTINELHDTQDHLDFVVQLEVVQTYNGGIVLCQLLLAITDKAHHPEILQAFAKQNVDCEAPLKPLPLPDGTDP